MQFFSRISVLSPEWLYSAACRTAVAVVFLVLCASGVSATQVIANWDVVPFQCISQPFKAGVVAFHETGVDVEFRINGEAAGRIADPAWNDQTGVFEYWIEINPARYADGPLTVSATVWPDGADHENRILSDLTLYADAGGSLTTRDVKWADAANGSDTTGDGSESNPYQTIKKAVLSVGDGGTVYLKAGTNYILNSIGGSNFTYWTTVTCAPGLTADDVHIGTYLVSDSTSTGRYGKSGIRWGKVSFYCDREPGWGSLFYLNTGHRTWFDGSVMYDKKGRWANSTLINGEDPYTTGCYIHDLMNVNNSGILQRNNRFESIGSDIFRGANNLTAINTEIRLVDKGTTAAHPDFIQFYNPTAPVENIIIYNCKSYDMLAQGIFGAQGVVSNVAFVNLLLEKDPPDASFVSQVSGSIDHVLLWNATLVDQDFNFRDTTGLYNWDVRNCVFHTVSAATNTALPNGSSISFAHTGSLTWQQKNPLGGNATVGDPCFMDYDNDDYRLKIDSPAYQTGTPLTGVPADIDGYLYDPVHPNRGAFSAANPGANSAVKSSARLTGVRLEPNGSSALVRVDCNGDARGGYLVESSNDLLSWTALIPCFADSQGSFGLAEIVNDSGSCRFYRFVNR